MEGELWKWTNYWNGWQSRWFILDRGVLSYYKTYDEVEQGCKGSLNVSACEISLHPTDHLRLDLAIPGEQHMYLRAKSQKNRQQWLIALGSAKACLSNQKANVRQGVSGSDGKGREPARKLILKEAELKMHCDILMMQVHGVKEAIKDKNNIDIEKLDEGSGQVAKTCDTFISTLDELMILHSKALNAIPEGVGQGCPTPVQNGVGGIQPTSSTRTGSIERATLPGMISLANQHNRQQRCRTASSDSVLSNASFTSVDESYSKNAVSVKKDGFQSVFGNNHHNLPTRSNQPSPEKTLKQALRSSVTSQDENSQFNFPFKSEFPNVQNHQLIPTQAFLDSCNEALKLFDILGAKSFSPIKIDSLGHLEAVKTKFKSDPEYFCTLQMILNQEKQAGKGNNLNSGTMSLKWLLRNLKFVHSFWQELVESTGDDSIQDCLANSYQKTLLKHHELVVRSVYSVAIKNSPDRTTFFNSLSIPANLCQLEEQQNFFQAKVVPQLAPYLDSMERCLMILMEQLEI